jgi:hypothetical protein
MANRNESVKAAEAKIKPGRKFSAIWQFSNASVVSSAGTPVSRSTCSRATSAVGSELSFRPVDVVASQ